jgi:hypothetical protein
MEENAVVFSALPRASSKRGKIELPHPEQGKCCSRRKSYYHPFIRHH